MLNNKSKYFKYDIIKSKYFKYIIMKININSKLVSILQNYCQMKVTREWIANQSDPILRHGTNSRIRVVYPGPRHYLNATYRRRDISGFVMLKCQSPRKRAGEKRVTRAG